ncbi:hypothetical protein BAE44_0009457 [Dichanthelium oligosanthes]|uniref:F-box associated domain-containing protein n=1 Tax=Dichanthelium oligosanthes TaxID=888268 RepID=A0A1E5VWP1_9POAL|nr:hypothetical protein BAE44_0009457 [Dichanthelium oligosanthes]
MAFRVICLALSKIKLVVFTFSSGGGQWHAAEFDDWSALTAGPANSSFSGAVLSGRYFAHKCFCWVMRGRNKLLVLDTCTMEFSSVDIPPSSSWRHWAIVEAGEGRFGLFTPLFDRQSRAYDLLYIVLRNDGQGANQWQWEAKIRLPLNYHYNILGAAGGYLLLLGFSEPSMLLPASERPKKQCFSLNLKTFQIEWFCESISLIEDAPLYAGFPPSLSPPTI